MTVVEALPRTRTEAILLGGRYRLTERLGVTGGTPVWQATDEILRRPVTIHLLPAWTPVRPGLPAAVQAGARVNDTRIATVFDADYSAGRPYIVSEWSSDPNLEQLLMTGLPSPALAALIVADAAAAIAAAHGAGRPHLCLRPRSLHWGRSGIKVTGLGIDAALSGADTSDPAVTYASTPAVTDTSTPAVTDTTDLARILYALLTGYWPGDEDTVLPALRRSWAGFPEPRQIRPGVPSILNAITCHALHGQPAWGRPSIFTPAGLATALRAAQRSMLDCAGFPRLSRTFSSRPEMSRNKVCVRHTGDRAFARWRTAPWATASAAPSDRPLPTAKPRPDRAVGDSERRAERGTRVTRSGAGSPRRGMPFPGLANCAYQPDRSSRGRKKPCGRNGAGK